MLKSEYADKKLAGESKTSESYWGDQGQYQDLYNKYHSEIPDEGSVNDSLLEQLRIVSNVYYDVGNNGGVNMISGMGSAGEHGKINGFIPETIRLVNKVEQADNKGKELKYDEEQRLIQASLQELDGIVDNLLQQIKNDRTDKDEQSNYWGESKATEDFGQFTIQNPNLITDGYPTDEEGFARASWDDAEIEDRKKWLIRAGFPDNAEEDAYLPYYSLQTMIRAVLSQDLHVGSIKAMAESKATEGSIEWTEVDERGLKVIDTGSTYKTEDGDTIIWSSFDADQAQRRLNQIVSNQSNKSSELAPTIEDMKYDDEPMRFGDGRGILGDPLYPESTKKEEEPKLDTEEEIDEFIKKEADEIVGALAVNDELEGIKDTYGSSPNADPTTTPLEDHSGTDDSSDTQLDTVDAQQETSDVVEDTVEESFGDCGCKDTKKARTTWESAIEGDKQYWLRNMGEDEGYSYYHFEHLPKRVGESLVNKFKVEESEDRGWSKIPALERANLLKKLGFPPRDAELVANLEYPQLSESLKKDVNDAVGVKKKAEESKREKPDGQLAFENDLYSNMYDGYLQRRGQRVDSKKNNKF